MTQSRGTKSVMLGRKISRGTFKTMEIRAGLIRVSLFKLEVPLCNLRPSWADFVPCDKIVQSVC